LCDATAYGGISDACELVESAQGRRPHHHTHLERLQPDVFAFRPCGSTQQRGCNRLIRDNGAALITSDEDFVKAMGWEQDALLAQARQQGIERQLFPDLSANEQKVVDLLQKTNDLQLNIISVKCALPVGTVTSLLFTLEMKGVVKAFAGGTYHLIK
jgi:DNA processing protein